MAIALPPAAVGLVDHDARRDGEAEVLGVERREQDAEPERLDGREPVDRLHPFRHRGVLARLRAALPLLHAEGDGAQAEEQDHDVAERRAARLVGRARGIAQAEHDAASRA